MITSLVKKERGEQRPGVFDSTWPFGGMWDAMVNMEKAFSDFFGETRPLSSRTGMLMPAVPAMDLYKEGDSYVVEAAIPGYRKGDIELHATEDSLTLSCQVKEEKRSEEKDRFWSEIHRGSFRRTLHLQEPVRSDKIKAVFKDGLLKVTLPLEEPKKSQHIKIDIE
jgi:HSP20 family protein